MTTPAALEADLTPAWLSRALGSEVTAAETSTVGTGQMGVCYRVRLSGDAALPATVLAKLPTPDTGMRTFLAAMYATEVGFYRDIADTVAVAVPHIYYGETGDDGVFTLLMQDLAPSKPGDQIAGCTVDQARAALVNLAGLHGPRWNDATLPDTTTLTLPLASDGAILDETLPPATEQAIEALGSALSAEAAETFLAVAAAIGRWHVSQPPRIGLVHGDYRLDNLMFSPGGEVHALDWQGLTLGLPGRDVAFFLGTGLSVEDRRNHEKDLVAVYHEALIGHGVTDYSFEECWDDYRLGMPQIALITVFGCAYSARAERGDRMFTAMLERGAAAIRDLDTLELIP